MTTLFESLACCRPVIMTKTPGIVEHLVSEDAIIGVKPGDSTELRNAITFLLENPQKAESMTKKAMN